VRSLYSINDQRQRAINLDDTACRFTESTDVNFAVGIRSRIEI